MSVVAGLALTLQPVAAMEQAIRVGSPSGPPPGPPAIRPPAQPPRWELVEQQPPSRWAAPSATTPTAAAASPAPPSALNWELVVPAVAESPTQPPAAQPEIAAEPTWEPILPGEEITSADVAREVEAQESARQREQMAASSGSFSDPDSTDERKHRWILGFGGGARIGIGEPTFPLAYGRLGIRTGNDFAVSLRPSYIFGNSDREGISNNQGAFQMPLTVDFAPDSRISPFLGLGMATNTDSTNSTKPMATIGLDINITRNITLAAAINVIYQREDEDSRDVEAISVIYFRF
ncbi:MAG: hypothetical protein ACK5GZ_02015 [Cyanobium sp.]|jgi:hypothetical protein